MLFGVYIFIYIYIYLRTYIYKGQWDVSLYPILSTHLLPTVSGGQVCGHLFEFARELGEIIPVLLGRAGVEQKPLLSNAGILYSLP